MRHLILTAALLLPLASAQVSVSDIPALPPSAVGPVAKVEIEELEVKAAVSTNATPTVASGDQGEIMVPVVATDKNDNPVAGVAVTWEVKNTGKNPLYVISSIVNNQSTAIAATISPDQTVKYETMTGVDGSVTLLLNATASTSATLTLTASTGEVKNLGGSTQTIEWTSK
ncbi:hypothetical protein [Deinococcus marmoris]|uniref:Uncharacterized protein n=1 Tax=Deinococcus marmoris TaxID=249408 RepID=A0A1U7NWI8_9DEIO|nr:hypothetical protein [Deinococcus marmoris]OLV17298.1 hypothetical protein BOO71_0009508 [Deinococcus marmoris]OLV18641.1 hypothetical protein BOO71_0004963 [Deinococcus marmoris]